MPAKWTQKKSEIYHEMFPLCIQSAQKMVISIG